MAVQTIPKERPIIEQAYARNQELTCLQRGRRSNLGTFLRSFVITGALVSCAVSPGRLVYVAEAAPSNLNVPAIVQVFSELRVEQPSSPVVPTAQPVYHLVSSQKATIQTKQEHTAVQKSSSAPNNPKQLSPSAISALKNKILIFMIGGIMVTVVFCIACLALMMGTGKEPKEPPSKQS